MEYTVYNIDTEITLLPLLLKISSMSKMRFWYDTETVEEKYLETIAISYSNCGKETGFSMKNMNANYKDIITNFLLNTMSNHVGMSWIIETNKQL